MPQQTRADIELVPSVAESAEPEDPAAAAAVAPAAATAAATPAQAMSDTEVWATVKATMRGPERSCQGPRTNVVVPSETAVIEKTERASPMLQSPAPCGLRDDANLLGERRVPL